MNQSGTMAPEATAMMPRRNQSSAKAVRTQNAKRPMIVAIRNSMTQEIAQ